MKLNSVTMMGKDICIYMFTDARMNVGVVNMLSKNSHTTQQVISLYFHISNIFLFKRDKERGTIHFQAKKNAMFKTTLLQMRSIDCEKHYNYLMGIWETIDRIYFHIIENGNVDSSNLAHLKKELHTLFDQSGRYNKVTRLLYIIM